MKFGVSSSVSHDIMPTKSKIKIIEKEKKILRELGTIQWLQLEVSETRCLR